MPVDENVPPVLVRPFRRADQDGVRQLVLAGLRERWGALDHGLNRDLDDIATTYASGRTLTAWSGDRLVGTATLVPLGPDVSEVVRMSTVRECRRRGVAGLLLQDLLDEARQGGVRKVVLETAAEWADARSFYERHGFVLDREVDGELCRDAFYSLDLSGCRAATRGRAQP